MTVTVADYFARAEAVRAAGLRLPCPRCGALQRIDLMHWHAKEGCGWSAPGDGDPTPAIGLTRP